MWGMVRMKGNSLDEFYAGYEWAVFTQGIYGGEDPKVDLDNRAALQAVIDHMDGHLHEPANRALMDAMVTAWNARRDAAMFASDGD